ncbi:hypothetical protein SCLCIDRAFT_121546, partial [Scleroderma citrinum Foug A]
VKLGSSQKLLTFQEIEQCNANDSTFERFRIKLNIFLGDYFRTVRGALPQGRRIQFKADDTVTEHRYIKVNFESKVDWCQYTDYLRCSPSFHGHARHDCVILRTSQQCDIFGRLLFLFTCSDKHLGFWRVREQPCTSSEIFSVQSIVRGALLFPDSARDGEHLVIDTIDTDMFLRVQEMHRDAGHY